MWQACAGYRIGWARRCLDGARAAQLYPSLMLGVTAPFADHL